MCAEPFVQDPNRKSKGGNDSARVSVCMSVGPVWPTPRVVCRYVRPVCGYVGLVCGCALLFCRSALVLSICVGRVCPAGGLV